MTDPDPPDRWDRTAAWIAAHGALPALGVLTIVAGAIYAGVFRGEIIGDDLTFHMAEARRLADCLRTGDWDFWNPSANGGFASLYYYQAVPQLASAVPAALFGHFVFWFQLSVFLPHLLAPAAAYRGARMMGATPWQAFAAALAVAMISGQSRWGTGGDGTFQVGLYTQTWALAAFPLALGYGVRWITAGERLPAAIAWGAFVTLCHPFAGISLGVVFVIGAAAYELAALVGALHALPPLGRLASRLGGAPGSGVRLVAAAGCATGFTLNLVLLLFRGAWFYIIPVSVFGAAAARLTWDLLATRAAPPPRPLGRELLRVAILGVTMLLAALPVWLTVAVDYDGFGGFPHRVADEVGPGYNELMRWQLRGAVLDFQRPPVLTWLIPIVACGARAPFLRWLWPPAAVFAALLALGPHLPKTADDLLPAVRFLGAMQIVLAMGVGAGAVALGARLWHAPLGSPLHTGMRLLFASIVLVAAEWLAFSLAFGDELSMPLRIASALTLDGLDPLVLRIAGVAIVLAAAIVLVRPMWSALATTGGIRTALAAATAALVVLLTVDGAAQLGSRVRVLRDYGAMESEIRTMIEAIRDQPAGRKQVTNGAEHHWWNQLTYVYARRPALFQMGGGGLQASPNYDFMWSVRDFAKLAWVYDAPYLLFARTAAATQPAGETLRQTASFELRRIAAPGVVSPIQITGILPPGRAAARKAGIEWLRTDLPLHNRHLVYDGHGFPGAPPDARVLRTGRTGSPGDAADLFAEVDVSQPSTFVFRESWHPRWRAYVDGAPVPIRRVTPDFPAIDAPPGRHLLQLRFERPWWAHASWLAWPVVPLLAWVATRRRRPARSEP